MASTGFHSRPKKDSGSSSEHSGLTPKEQNALSQIERNYHKTAPDLKAGQPAVPAHQIASGDQREAAEREAKLRQDKIDAVRQRADARQSDPAPSAGPAESSAEAPQTPQPSSSIPTSPSLKKPAASTLTTPAAKSTALPASKPGNDGLGLPGPGGFNPGGSRFRNYMTRHPKSVIWGIVAIIAAFFSLIVFLISVPFQLVHMAQILLDHNFSAGDRIEHKVGARVMQRLFQTKSEEPTGAKKATGHPIRDKMDNMKMDKFNKTLTQEGLKLTFDPSGKLISLSRISTGETVTDFKNSTFLERRTAIGEIVKSRVAPWNVLKRVHYTRLMQYHARVSFKFWPKEKVKDIRTLLTEKIRKGIAPADLATKTGGTAADQQAAKNASASNGTGPAAEAAKATTDAYAADPNKVAAIKVGTDKLKASATKFAGVTAVLSIVCTIQQLAAAVADGRYTVRLDLLMRAGNVYLTTSSQLLSGQNIDIDKLNQLMTRFNGDETAPADSVNRKAWDQSAAAKRINGEPIDSNPKSKTYNPDLSPSANPSNDALTMIASTVNAFFSAIPGFNIVCDVLNSFFGYVLQGLELIGAIISGGLEAGFAAVLQGVVVQLFFDHVVQWALEAATNLAVTGTDNAIEMFNNGDAGLSLSNSEYRRSYGSRQITNGEQVALVEAARTEQTQIAQSKGWFYRNLDLGNIHSVASNFLTKVPTSTSSAVAAITDLPRTFTASLATIMTGNFQPAFAADNVNPYNFQYYGFTQAEINAYPDPVANEEYLAQQLPGQPLPKDGGKTRLSILGDPSTYSPVDGPDPSTDDLMHCFVNPPAVPNLANITTDNICQGLGVLTGKDGSTVKNPNDQTVKDIYAKAGFGNIGYDNDLLRYRMELFYIHETRGLECASTDTDCFAGKGSATP
ncbi:MAG: hypothetical protein NVS3B29_05140 [Candidatus Saccharimonadales bacterium]